jgi:hypothetical protein
MSSQLLSLNKIKTDKTLTSFNNYIKFLNKFKYRKLEEVFTEAEKKVIELKDIKNSNLKTTDKGKYGKLVELKLFGNYPNNDRHSDLKELGIEVKTTKFKTLKNRNKKGFVNFNQSNSEVDKSIFINLNAKERLTLTNVGNFTKKDDVYLPKITDSITKFNTFNETKFFNKVKKILLICIDNSPEPFFLGMFIIDFDTFSNEIKEQIQLDFDDIKDKINSNSVSQKGQKYLHIHPHGCKNSCTRALGYTNRFLTSLAAEHIGEPNNDNKKLLKHGRSLYFQIKKPN